MIKRAVRSTAFRGVAVQRRKLEEGTLALDMQRAVAAPAGDRALPRTRAHDTAWGSAKATCHVIEECVPLDDRGATLTWLWHR